MSLHVGDFGFSSPFQPALNLRSISGTSARNGGDTKGLAEIDVDSASLSSGGEATVGPSTENIQFMALRHEQLSKCRAKGWKPADPGELDLPRPDIAHYLNQTTRHQGSVL